MKKLTPILIILLIIGVVSISGCISQVGGQDENSITDFIDPSIYTQAEPTETNDAIVEDNDSNMITIGTENQTILNQTNNTTVNQTPEISQDEIEKEIIRIMKLNDSNKNYKANSSLVYTEDGTPTYIVDVYDEKGWYGYVTVNGNTGPKGNDKDGYSFESGVIRNETEDTIANNTTVNNTTVENTSATENTTTNNTTVENTTENTTEDNTPLLSADETKEVMDKELDKNFTDMEFTYEMESFNENNTTFYNITIEDINSTDNSTIELGTAIIDAHSGEIVFLNMTKIYNVNEAGDYVDIVYKDTEVGVRQNYPYFSPQNAKIYYSQEEEAEDLYQMSLEFN